MERRADGLIRAGWDATYLVSDEPRPLLGFRSIKRVLDAAAQSPQAHVLAVSEDGDRRAEISAQIRCHFRFRWLSNADLVAARRDRFAGWVATLQPILEEEEQWAAQVKPSVVADALILPQCGFGHDRRLNIWAACEAYNAPNAVRDAVELIERFSGRYKRAVPGSGHHASRQQWVNDDGLIFDHRGPRHGAAPFPRRWKYSNCCDDGFHYDVKHSNNRAFTLSGILGPRDAVTGGYLNMDCHGYFRGENAD